MHMQQSSSVSMTIQKRASGSVGLARVFQNIESDAA